MWTETEQIIRTHLAGNRTQAWRLYLKSAGITMPDELFEMVFGTAPEGREAADERYSFEHMEVPQHLNWLILAIPLNRAMARPLDRPPFSPAELDHFAVAGVTAFLHAYAPPTPPGTA